MTKNNISGFIVKVIMCILCSIITILQLNLFFMFIDNCSIDTKMLVGVILFCTSYICLFLYILELKLVKLIKMKKSKYEKK